MPENTNNIDQPVTPSEWGKSLSIPETTIQEVKLYSNLGWAMDNSGKARQLTADEQKMMALATYKLGLSAMGKQLIFLGNSLYVTKGGKIAVARKDDNMPMVRVKVRPATKEEREAYGLLYNEPADSTKFEHLWYAGIYAFIGENIELVSDAFGHACVGNIKLYGKDNDPRRLCADMASTRAISRALSQVYDFFGIDSFEEVALMPDNQRPDPLDISGMTKATVVEKSENGGDALLTVQDVLSFMDDNKAYLPSEIINKFNKERLETYTDVALSETYKNIKSQVETKKQEVESQQPGLDIPEAKPKKGTGKKERAKEAEPENVS